MAVMIVLLGVESSMVSRICAGAALTESKTSTTLNRPARVVFGVRGESFISFFWFKFELVGLTRFYLVRNLRK